MLYMLHLLTLVFTLVLHIQTAHAGGAGSVSNANDIDSITPAIINDTCTDYPEFKDQYGSCDDYVAKKWCESGTSGGGWDQSWGPLSTRVSVACCACGKGHSVDDHHDAVRLKDPHDVWQPGQYCRCKQH